MTGHVTAASGSTARLRCTAVGRPAPQITWYKDGVRLVVDDDDEAAAAAEDVGVVDATQTTHELTLRQLVPADGGRYRCTAINRHGNASFTYSLHVLGQSRSPTSYYRSSSFYLPDDTTVWSMHIYIDTILEEQDSKVRQEH